MPAQYSLRGDGKPVFSDCNALGVERNYGCKSHFQDSSSGDPGFCDLPGTKTQRQRGTGFFSQPGRSPCGTLLDRTIYL